MTTFDEILVRQRVEEQARRLERDARVYEARHLRAPVGMRARAAATLVRLGRWLDPRSLDPYTYARTAR